MSPQYGPWPNDPGLQIQLDQLPPSVVNAQGAGSGLAPVADGSNGYAWGATSIDRLDGLVCPFPPAAVEGIPTQPNANYVYGVRVVIPKTGTLHDLAVCYSSPSGNIRIGVYDTGDALAGSRSLLYGSGSVAESGTNTWQIVADPALAVTRGQQVDLVITNSVSTPGIATGSTTSIPNNIFSLPASFFPAAGGASPKLSWWFNNSGYAALPATIAEASCVASYYYPLIIARVA